MPGIVEKKPNNKKLSKNAYRRQAAKGKKQVSQIQSSRDFSNLC